VFVSQIVNHGFRIHAPRRARSLLAAAAAACLLCALAVVSWPGNADSAPLRMVVLGKTSSTPAPACPAKSRVIGGQTIVVKACQAVGRATIFQSLAGDTVKPYLAPFDGKIVSWSISLSKPTGKERKFFNDVYGSPSQARIAVLRPVPNEKPPVYKLVRQSPAQQLNGYFGQTVTFALDHPLNVVAGQMIGLTLPTWAPNWAINLASNNSWRSSRQSDKCADSYITKGLTHPQTKIGSKRQYGCYFTGSRLLYSATLVKKPLKG